EPSVTNGHLATCANPQRRAKALGLGSRFVRSGTESVVGIFALRMSAWGQSEKSGRPTGRSPLLPTPDVALHRENRRFGPTGDIEWRSVNERGRQLRQSLCVMRFFCLSFAFLSLG